jgi:hypothetical protein
MNTLTHYESSTQISHFDQSFYALTGSHILEVEPSFSADVLQSMGT